MEVLDSHEIPNGQQLESFSHELCVAKSFARVQDCLAQEMREGFSEQKTDASGNILTVLHPDSRRQAIEAITTLKNVMIADLNKENCKEYKEKVNKLLKQDREIFNNKLKQQINYYNSFPIHERQKLSDYIPFIKSNTLNDKSPFYHAYLIELVSVYREIFEQLELCLADLKYFGGVLYSN